MFCGLERIILVPLIALIDLNRSVQVLDGKLFHLMYEMMGKVKENILSDDEIFSTDYNKLILQFLCRQDPNIRNMHKEYGSFGLGKKEPGMTEFSQVSESYLEKVIGESMAINCLTDTIPSKFIEMFKVYFTPVITTLLNHSLITG